MKKIRLLSFLLLCLGVLFLSFACRSKPLEKENAKQETYEDSRTYSDPGEEESYTIDEEYYNGTYCAEVNYYNPNTGTSSVYTLKVEVEDNTLTTIYWPNGGWLDESHFNGEDISSGHCSFVSDVGYEYEVTLLDGGCTTSSIFEGEEEENFEEEEEEFNNWEDEGEEDEF